MASGIGTPLVSLWDSATGKLLRKLEGHTGAITALAWAPHGKALASKAVRGRMPLRREESASQNAALPVPIGVTMPSPVTTARREDGAMAHLFD